MEQHSTRQYKKSLKMPVISKEHAGTHNKILIEQMATLQLARLLLAEYLVKCPQYTADHYR